MRSVVSARLPALVGPRVGSRPPLLLLPGLGSTLAEFRAVLPSLALRYDVLAIELPGQGRSPALPATVRPTVAALTDAVEQELDRRGCHRAARAGCVTGRSSRSRARPPTA